MDYDHAPPEPAGMVKSLSSLGYSLSSAVADLIDNSLSASATRIDVVFTWAGRDSWIAVCDNGDGMAKDALVKALTVAAGGATTNRSAQDLGRFGMGLKSASFSQADQVTVTTTEGDGVWHTRTWDLTVVHDTGEWRLLYGADDSTLAVLDRLRESSQSGVGTVVVWRSLRRYRHLAPEQVDDQQSQRQFYDDAHRTLEHLGMVFSRFLTGAKRRRININGDPVVAWDPFMTHHPALQGMPVETLVNGRTRARVEGFILPGRHRLSEKEYETGAGPGGWLTQQGFYVYRRDRLILAGGWLGQRGMRREEKFNLARISVDIDADADTEWSVDVRKAAVTPPVASRNDLKRIAMRAREQASEVLRHRGRTVSRATRNPFEYIWSVDRRNDQITCVINREHPLVETALKSAGNKGAVRALLRFLEETIPVTRLRIMHEAETSDDPEPFGGQVTAPTEMVDIAQVIYQSLMASGLSPQNAKSHISTMHPFDQAVGFWSE